MRWCPVFEPCTVKQQSSRVQSRFNMLRWVLWLSVAFLSARHHYQVESFLASPCPYTSRRLVAAAAAVAATREQKQVVIFNKGDGEITNNEIMRCFDGDDAEIIATKLKFLVMDKRNRINHVHAATFMQRAAKQKINILEAFPAEFLLELLKKSSGDVTESGETTWKPSEIAQVLYGMRYMNLRQKGVAEMIELVIERLKSCTTPFTGQEVANCFYGLQNMPTSLPNHNAILVRLMSRLTRKLSQCKSTLSSQEYSNVLYGLRRMKEVDVPSIFHDVLFMMGNSISEASQRPEGLHFTVQGISNCLNGLQGCSDEKKHVGALLRALLPHLRDCSELMSMGGIGIGSSAMGLACMSGKSKEVRDIVGVLADKIEGSPELPMSHASVVSAFSGLRGLNDTIPEVRRLVAGLNSKMEASLAEGDHYSPVSIGNILHGMREMAGEYCEVRHTYALLARAVASQGTAKFPSADLGKCVYGLKSLSMATADSVEVRALLAQLARKWQALDPESESSARATSMALYGMRFISHVHNVPEAGHLLSALAQQVKSLTRAGIPFNAQCSSMCMLGIQKCSPGDAQHGQAVCDILDSLANKNVMGTIDSQSIGNCLYAMSKMSSDDREVKGFLKSLTRQMKVAQLRYTDQEMANAFYGLQSMNSLHPEVIDLLTELSKGLAGMTKSFNSQGMGNALTGFQTMSSDDSPVVISTLGLFADKIDSMNLSMRPLDIANAVYGLQGMTAEAEEVRAVISALTVKMRESTEIFTARDISYCLTGLAGMQKNLGVDEVSEMLAELNLKVSTSPLRGIPNLEFKQYGYGTKSYAV